MREEFEALLSRMPDIAKAVSAFDSESIQMEAFRSLVSAFLGEGHVRSHQEVAQPARAASDTPATRNGADSSAIARRTSPRSKQAHALIKSLDLVKGAAKSFEDFANEKQPKTHEEKCLVSVYWLERLANVKPVTSDHVYTAFKHLDWEIPADLGNKLSVTGSKGWLDSRKRDDLKIVVGGENYVEHRMPRIAKK
jgi:hypothetical protein